VDFALDDDQRALEDGLAALLDRFSARERVAQIARDGGCDDELDRALGDAGFCDVARDMGDGDARRGRGPLAAACAIEAIAQRGLCVPFAARALVAPALGVEAGRLARDAIVTLATEDRGRTSCARYAQHATLAIVARGGDGDARASARLVALADPSGLPGDDGDAISRYPSAPTPLPLQGPTLQGDLGPGSSERARAWWRVAIAAEIAGFARGALDATVAYLTEREQFGRPIGSFQAVQHRLADCAVRVEATRWLAFEAAWLGAPALQAASAAGYAADTAEIVFREMHQLSGAIGFTREHALHVFTLPLVVLRLELGGASAHHRALARARWSEALSFPS